MAREGDEAGEADPRTLALSDGVFAIALTLLVLALHTPENASDLGKELVNQYAEFFAWLLSFIVIALNWLRHRTVFAAIGEVDGVTARLNLAYLAGISFLPFPTDLIARYADEWQSVALYAGTLALVSTLLGVIAVRAKVPQSRYWWLVPVIILTAIPLSFAVGSKALFVLLLMRLVPRTKAEPA